MAVDRSIATDEEGALAWLSRFGEHVAHVDFASARDLFADDVVAFGTWTELLDGRDALESKQWQQVWPTIEGFTFELRRARALVSGDRLQAVVVAPWTSTGFHADGQPFDRPGRATLVLRRGAPDEGWRAVHSHFSLGRDVPQRSHGRPAGTSPPT